MQGSTLRSRCSGHAQAAALLLLALAGCQPAMSTPPSQPAGHLTIVPNEFPLRFKWHNFEAHCYNTIGCSVFYAGIYQVRRQPDELSAPPIAQYKTNWGGAPHVGIDNFPPPAIVKWRSLDGQPHEAEVDIGAIFKNQKILHHVPEADIPEGWAHDLDANIYLEVNDRVINVYMQAHIATKQQQEPGNPYSDYRNELVLAWSHSY